GLEHFRESELHLLRERGKMCSRDLVVSVLDEVQMLDQQVAPPRPVAQKKRNLFSRLRVNLAALRGRLGAPPPLARMFERADLLHVMTHRNTRFSTSLASDCSSWHTKCQQECAVPE